MWGVFPVFFVDSDGTSFENGQKLWGLRGVFYSCFDCRCFMSVSGTFLGGSFFF